MKTILITLFTILCFVGYAIAEGSPEYIDSGLKAGDKTIWFGFNMTSENNICIDNDNNEKECLIYCKWCDIALFQDTDDMYMLSLADKGILYQEDEFQVAYYDLSTGKIIGISSDINMFLTKYKAPGNAIVLDDVHWSEFKNEDFNEDKTKIALKLNYYKPDDNEIKNAMICILDIEKLTNLDKDYFECPIITDWLRRVETEKIDSNLWREEDEYLKFEEWKNGKIEIKADKNDYILNIDNNTLEKKPFNYISFVVIALSLLGIVGVAFFLRRRKK